MPVLLLLLLLVMGMIFNTGCSCFVQVACETFDVRGKHHIQIPKLYTSNVTWDPQLYRLVQDSEPLDLNKGTRSPAPHGTCLPLLPGWVSLRPELWSRRPRGPSEQRQPAWATGLSLSRCIQEPVGI